MIVAYKGLVNAWRDNMKHCSFGLNEHKPFFKEEIDHHHHDHDHDDSHDHAAAH